MQTATMSKVAKEEKLCAAARYGKLAEVKRLVAENVDLNCHDNSRYGYGNTPILWGSQGGHAAIVSFLIEARAQLDTTSNGGATALYRAAAYGREECVRILLAAGADTKIKDNDGKTAADLAKQYKRTAIVKMIAAHEAALARGGDRKEDDGAAAREKARAAAAEKAKREAAAAAEESRKEKERKAAEAVRREEERKRLEADRRKKREGEEAEKKRRLAAELEKREREEAAKKRLAAERKAVLQSYGNSLKLALRDGVVETEEEELLAAERKTHAITPEEHVAALQAIGSSEEKYQAAIRAAAHGGGGGGGEEKADETNEVAAWLKTFKMERYAGAFEEEGYDSMEIVREVVDLDALINVMKVKNGHARMIVKNLEMQKTKVTDAYDAKEPEDDDIPFYPNKRSIALVIAQGRTLKPTPNVDPKEFAEQMKLHLPNGKELYVPNDAVRKAALENAKRMKAFFEDSGYYVVYFEDDGKIIAGKGNMLTEFESELEENFEDDPPDSCVVYFAGHGLEDSVCSNFVKYDKKAEKLVTRQTKIEKFIDKIDRMDALNGKPKVYFWECCRGSEASQAGGEEIVHEMIYTPSKGKHILQAYATGFSKVSYPGDLKVTDGLSTWTYYLLQHLAAAKKKRGLAAGIDQVLKQVSVSVEAYARDHNIYQKQVPEVLNRHDLNFIVHCKPS